MDPTLTRSQAHQVFGDLYRKPRSPELQEEVDRIVSSTSDVFVRIKRIEELDNRAKRTRTNGDSSDDREQVRRRPAGGRGASSGGGGGGPATAGGSARKKTRSRSDSSGQVGILTRLIGGELAVWGKETGTMAVAMFGLNISLSKRTVDLFSSLREDQIVSALKCFRALMQYGWEKWEPSVYNVIMTAYQFFTEYIKAPGVFRKKEGPAIWASDTTRMQKYYASLISYPNYKTILGEEAVKLASTSDELTSHLGHFKTVANFIASLEARRPSMTNAIIALYALQNRKVYQWEDMVRQLGVGDPIQNRYKAPESILSMINGRIKKLKEGISLKQGEIREIEEIQKKYFQFDGAGKVKVDFLNDIFEEVVRRSFSDKISTDSVIKSHRSQPHKLLFIILRDMDIAVAPLLSGSVSLKSGGSSEDVILFKQGLFRVPLEELATLLREVDAFNKKNNTFEYTFKEYKEDMARGTHDPVAVNFIQLAKRANKIFHLMVFDLKTVLDNHEMALNAERSGKNVEKLSRTRSISVESFEIGMRYMPHYDRVILSNTRNNNRTVEDAIRSIVMNLYNYLYIYRDTELIKTLSSITKIHSEISNLKSELVRLGIEEE